MNSLRLVKAAQEKNSCISTRDIVSLYNFRTNAAPLLYDACC